MQDQAPETIQDYTKLPIEERLTHKIWKVRLEAYECIAQIAIKEGDLKISNETYKKISTDSNQAAFEQMLKSLNQILTNVPLTTGLKIRDNVVVGVIEKSFLSSKQSTKNLAFEVLANMIEIDQPNFVIEKTTTFVNHKTPKVVATTFKMLADLISEFGKVIEIKGILKVLEKGFNHSDKNVRTETSNLGLEIASWYGQGIVEQHIQNIKAVQIKELKEKMEMSKVHNKKPKRVLNSMKDKIQEVETDTMDVDNNTNAEDIQEELDPYDIAEPINIFEGNNGKIVESFYKEIESKKWMERKEALDKLAKLTSVIKLENSPKYGELISKANKHVADVNLAVSVSAVLLIGNIAVGLRKDFLQYKNIVISNLANKFKDKKQNIVDQLRRTLCEIGQLTDTTTIMDDIQPFLKHKNPTVKKEIVLILVSKFKKMVKVPNKQEIKKAMDSVLELVNDGDTNVREAALEFIGVCMKICGESIINAYIKDIDKIKTDKIKEYCQSSEISIKRPSISSKPPQSKQTSAEPKAQPKPPTSTKPVSATSSKPKKRPILKPKEKKPTETKKHQPLDSKTKTKESPTKGHQVVIKYKPEDLDSLIPAIVSSETMDKINSAQWKTRLEGMNEFNQLLRKSSSDTINAEVICHQLNKKPSWKESNFQVTLLMIESLFILSQQHSSTFTKGCISLCINSLLDKMNDIKLRAKIEELVTNFIETTSPGFVIDNFMLEKMKTQKSPKTLADLIKLMHNVLELFGSADIDIKKMVEYTNKYGLNNPNSNVKANSLNIISYLCVHVGGDIKLLLTGLSSSLMQSIDGEITKRSAAHGKAVPLKTYKDIKTTKHSSNEIIPRVYINAVVDETTIKNMSDPNWKARNESLLKLTEIINANKISNIDSLAKLIKDRLIENNKNIVQTALSLVLRLLENMGNLFEKHLKLFTPAVCHCLSDNKPNIRSSAVLVLTKISTCCSFNAYIDEIALVIKTNESPMLRKELLTWLQTISNLFIEKELGELTIQILKCIKDKSAETRKLSTIVLQDILAKSDVSKVKDKCKSTIKPASNVQDVLNVIDKLAPPTHQLPRKEPNQKPPSNIDTGLNNKRKSNTRTPLANSKDPKQNRNIDITTSTIEKSPLKMNTTSGGYQIKRFSLEFDKLDEGDSIIDETMIDDMEVSSNQQLQTALDEKDLIETTIFRLSSMDNESCLEGLIELNDKLSTCPEILKHHINTIVSSLYTKFESLDISENEEDPELALAKEIVRTLITLFSIIELSTSVDVFFLQGLIEKMLIRIIDENIRGFTHMSRSLNFLMARVIENCRIETTIEALFELTKQRIEDLCEEGLDPNSKRTKYKVDYAELTLKCIWKLTKKLAIKDDTIDYSKILYLLNEFLNTYGHNFWRSDKRPVGIEDLPYKTMKTILNQLIKSLGKRLLRHTDLIKEKLRLAPTNYHDYISLLLQSSSVISLDNTPDPDFGGEKNASPNPEQNNEKELNDIFTKIMSKEFTKQGLRLLYDFKRKNPPLIELVNTKINSNTKFKTYINQGLQQIEKNVKNSRTNSRLNTSHEADENNTSKEVESIRRKLDKLKSNLQ